jgi:hypothetical protein
VERLPNGSSRARAAFARAKDLLSSQGHQQALLWRLPGGTADASLRSEFVTFLICRVFSAHNRLVFSTDFLRIQ